MDINKENLKTTTAPSIIWRLPLTPIEKILLFNLAYLERDGKVTNKTQTLLAYIAGTTIPSVIRCMANMEKNGWIARTKMFAQSDIYTINWDMIIKETKESDIMGTIQKNIKQKEDGTFEKIDEENTNTTYLISSNSIEDENANTTYLSPSNSKDGEMYYQETEEPTDGLKTAIEEEMLETLLSDEEIIEKVAKEFIETEGDSGYKMFIELNSTNPKSDNFRVLSNKWKHKCERYITTEERARLADRITDIVWKRYYQRYKKEVA